MRKIIAGVIIVSAVIGYSSCQKQTSSEEKQALTVKQADAKTGRTACISNYLQLAIDPLTGGSYIYAVTNSPSNGPISVINVNGSAGNNRIGSSNPLTAVTMMTGLSYDPFSDSCYGITGSAGSHPHSLVRFKLTDVNVVNITPLFTLGTVFDLSDIERDPFMHNTYYAINRAVAGNNRIATVDVTTGQVTTLPSATGLNFQGLAVDTHGKLYLMSMTGTSGDVYVADPGSGAIILGPCPYGVVIAPGALGPDAEMGLHFEDACTNLLVTGNYTGKTRILTDALPVCLGGPVPPSVPLNIKPTVDFAKQ